MFSEPSLFLADKLTGLNYLKCHCRGKERGAIRGGERHMRGCITNDTENYYSYWTHPCQTQHSLNYWSQTWKGNSTHKCENNEGARWSVKPQPNGSTDSWCLCSLSQKELCEELYQQEFPLNKKNQPSKNTNGLWNYCNWKQLILELKFSGKN